VHWAPAGWTPVKPRRTRRSDKPLCLSSAEVGAICGRNTHRQALRKAIQLVNKDNDQFDHAADAVRDAVAVPTQTVTDVFNRLNVKEEHAGTFRAVYSNRDVIRTATNARIRRAALYSYVGAELDKCADVICEGAATQDGSRVKGFERGSTSKFTKRSRRRRHCTNEHRTSKTCSICFQPAIKVEPLFPCCQARF